MSQTKDNQGPKIYQTRHKFFKRLEKKNSKVRRLASESFPQHLQWLEKEAFVELRSTDVIDISSLEAYESRNEPKVPKLKLKVADIISISDDSEDSSFSNSPSPRDANSDSDDDPEFTFKRRNGSADRKRKIPAKPKAAKEAKVRRPKQAKAKVPNVQKRILTNGSKLLKPGFDPKKNASAIGSSIQQTEALNGVFQAKKFSNNFQIGKKSDQPDPIIKAILLKKEKDRKAAEDAALAKEKLRRYDPLREILGSPTKQPTVAKEPLLFAASSPPCVHIPEGHSLGRDTLLASFENDGSGQNLDPDDNADDYNEIGNEGSVHGTDNEDTGSEPEIEIGTLAEQPTDKSNSPKKPVSVYSSFYAENEELDFEEDSDDDGNFKRRSNKRPTYSGTVRKTTVDDTVNILGQPKSEPIRPVVPVIPSTLEEVIIPTSVPIPPPVAAVQLPPDTNMAIRSDPRLISVSAASGELSPVKVIASNEHNFQVPRPNMRKLVSSRGQGVPDKLPEVTVPNIPGKTGNRIADQHSYANHRAKNGIPAYPCVNKPTVCQPEKVHIEPVSTFGREVVDYSSVELVEEVLPKRVKPIFVERAKTIAMSVRSEQQVPFFRPPIRTVKDPQPQIQNASTPCVSAGQPLKIREVKLFAFCCLPNRENRRHYKSITYSEIPWTTIGDVRDPRIMYSDYKVNERLADSGDEEEEDAADEQIPKKTQAEILEDLEAKFAAREQSITPLAVPPMAPIVKPQATVAPQVHQVQPNVGAKRKLITSIIPPTLPKKAKPNNTTESPADIRITESPKSPTLSSSTSSSSSSSSSSQSSISSLSSAVVESATSPPSPRLKHKMTMKEKAEQLAMKSTDGEENEDDYKMDGRVYEKTTRTITKLVKEEKKSRPGPQCSKRTRIVAVRKKKTTTETKTKTETTVVDTIHNDCNDSNDAVSGHD